MQLEGYGQLYNADQSGLYNLLLPYFTKAAVQKQRRTESSRNSRQNVK